MKVIILLIILAALVSISHLIHNPTLLNYIFKDKECKDVDKCDNPIDNNINNIKHEVAKMRFPSIPEPVNSKNCPILSSLPNSKIYLSNKNIPNDYHGLKRISYQIDVDKFVLVDTKKKFESTYLNIINNLIVDNI